MVENLNLKLRQVASKKLNRLYFILGIILTILICGITYAHKTITINIDGTEKVVTTFKMNVNSVLNENLIELYEKDKIEPALDAKLLEDEIITIKRAKEINVDVDGQVLKIKSAEPTVGDMILVEGIELSELDRIEPSIETNVENGLDIKITRVEEKIITESEALKYETIVTNDENLDNTIVKTVQAGVEGEKQITSKVVIEDGQEVSRKVIEEKIVREPVQERIVKGTMNTLVLSRGETIKYKKKMRVEATAYSGDTITATGTVPKRNPNGLSTIAVDPRVIPLGTKVYVENYGYAVAEDTGGAIKNNIIDIFLDSSSECYKWGRRKVNLYIIAYPGQW